MIKKKTCADYVFQQVVPFSLPFLSLGEGGGRKRGTYHTYWIEMITIYTLFFYEAHAVSH